jgi:hypothetical protein
MPKSFCKLLDRSCFCFLIFVEAVRSFHVKLPPCRALAYGGLKPETIKRLEAIAEDLDGGDPARRRRLANDRPIAGTRLIREYQGVEHCVTVRDEDFEYQGRPYKSLSAVARAITGTQWNGLVFFGLKNQRAKR